MTTLTELSRRVSEAEGPSRELDREIHFYLRGGLPTFSRGELLTGPRYTASLDAVVALIAEKLPGYAGSVSIGADANPFAWLAPPEGTQGNARWNWLCEKDVHAKTPALALLAAALLAIHERDKSDDNR